MEGFWLEPSGGIIHVATCKDRLCARIVAFDNDKGVFVDVNNEDPSLRSRSLCNLELGTGFRVVDASHAEDGSIYDPKTGKTYRAALTQEGGTLRLRGYVGIKLFGRTEVWRRVASPNKFCVTRR
jgi:uncharacterized protein (DUF2147 family)